MKKDEPRGLVLLEQAKAKGFKLAADFIATIPAEDDEFNPAFYQKDPYQQAMRYCNGDDAVDKDVEKGVSMLLEAMQNGCELSGKFLDKASDEVHDFIDPYFDGKQPTGDLPVRALEIMEAAAVNSTDPYMAIYMHTLGVYLTPI